MASALKTRKRRGISSGLNNTTTPAGIAANDPDALVGVRFRGDIVGPKCPPAEHGLIVDPEIRDLIEPLTPHERGTLKANLEREGCLDPLKGWKETGILLDGHNRKEICEMPGRSQIPFAVEWLSFADRPAAIAWVLANQLGRRNITAEQRAYLIGKRLELESQSRGGNRKSKVHDEPLKRGDTAARIAKETGKSRATVKRNGTFAKAVDLLANYSLPAKELLSGKTKMSPAAAKAVAEMKPREVMATATKLRNGSANTVDEAVGFVIQMPAKAKPAAVAAKKPDKRDVGETEFRETVLNRLRELQSLAGDPKGHLKYLRPRIAELLAFVEAWK